MDDSVWIKAIDYKALAPLDGLEGKWMRFLAPSEHSGGMIFGMGELAPGERAGWHTHPEPELFYVLEGSGVVRWEDDEGIHEHPFSSGQAFFKRGDVPHQMENVGDSIFRGLFFKLAVS